MVLQKLFCAFPSGWPGIGLLLLRGFVSFTLLAHTATYVSTSEVSALGWILIVLSVISAACLLVGLITPVMSIAVTLGAGVLAVSGRIESSLQLIVLAIAVGLLGPGAFSLDARMFGRREILLPNPRPPKP